MPSTNLNQEKESASKDSAAGPTHVRKVVPGLAIAACMITYMDRVIMSVTIPSIEKELGLSLVAMGTVTLSFRIAYAFFQIPGGWLGDKFGPRRALTGIVIGWSIFTAATGAAWNAISMRVIQFPFEAGEAGAYPVATRSLARWALPSERGFAQRMTHAGARAWCRRGVPATIEKSAISLLSLAAKQAGVAS